MLLDLKVKKRSKLAENPKYSSLFRDKVIIKKELEQLYKD